MHSGTVCGSLLAGRNRVLAASGGSYKSINTMHHDRFDNLPLSRRPMLNYPTMPDSPSGLSSISNTMSSTVRVWDQSAVVLPDAITLHPFLVSVYCHKYFVQVLDYRARHRNV